MTELGVRIAIDLRVAGLTLRLVDPLIDPTVALMLGVPTDLPITTPLIEITAACVELLQVTPLVIALLVPSVKVPIALICWVKPLAIDED